MKERRVSLNTGKRLELFSALLMQFLLYHCLACAALGVINEQDRPEQYLRMLFLLVPFCYLVWLRFYVKKFVWFMLLHAPVVFTAVLFGRSQAEETVAAVCTAVMLIRSIHSTTTKKKGQEAVRAPRLSALLLLLVCYYVGYFLHEPVLAKLCYYELPLFLLLFLVHKNLTNTERFIGLHRDTANFPVGQMVVINRLWLVLFLVMTVMGMLVVPLLPLEVILTPILQAALALLSWLLSLVKLPEAAEQMERISVRMAQPVFAGLSGEKGTGAIWILLEQILKVVVFVFILVFVVGGIGWILYRLYKGFYSEKKENTDEKEFLVGELKWFSKDWFSGIKKEREERGTINQKIRRVYRRYVKKGFKNKERVPESMTPDELLLFLKEKHGGLSEAERTEARRIYEQARYGYPECKADELEKLKRLLARP